MIQLKDVIHYHIGQKCLVIRNNERQNEDIVCYGLLAEFGIRGNASYQIKTIKPILRRLENMSEEEATELAKLQADPKRHGDIDILFIEKDHVHYMDGSKWEGNGVSEYNDLYVYFQALQPNQLHYLLQQGFDLFGLIPSGQAVDSKTIKQ